MTRPADIVLLEGTEAAAAIDDLAEVLVDCVAGGASVSFMSPFTKADAAAYFRRVAAEVERGDTALVGARLDGRIVGTVQLGLDTPPNQPHRADVKTMLVHRSVRRGGIGAALMQAVEEEARRRGRTVLVLDTASGDAERLYARNGWQRVGVIPDYALWPDGGLCATTFFWKRV
jgi:GNAT superfamily N-acetyltransferase